MMRSQLDLIEARLQTFIEGSFSNLIPWGNKKRMLAREFVRALHETLTSASDGSPLATSQYIILVNPSRVGYWESDPSKLKDLARTLYQAGMETGIQFKAPPELHVAPDAALPLQDIRIQARPSQEAISSTAVMDANSDIGGDANEPPPNAFLIVNGLETFPLNQPVINVGRKSDSHLLVDDPRVSRAHAQLRAIRGSYVLFDLNSTGGTFVNGQRITRVALKPGDVISLAGFPLIYGHDIPTGASRARKHPSTLPPGSTGQLPPRKTEP